MEYFGIDIAAIQAHCKEVGMQHVRFPVRDFDPFDLRLKLPKAVARLAKAHNPRHDVIYIHCTAGRALRCAKNGWTVLVGAHLCNSEGLERASWF